MMLPKCVRGQDDHQLPRAAVWFIQEEEANVKKQAVRTGLK